MITVAILNLLSGIIGTILSPLPTGSNLGLNTQAQAITQSSLWPQLGWYNNYIPISQMVLAGAIILSTVAVTLLIRVGLYLWNLLPIGGSN